MCIGMRREKVAQTLFLETYVNHEYINLRPHTKVHMTMTQIKWVFRNQTTIQKLGSKSPFLHSWMPKWAVEPNSHIIT